MTTTHPTTDTTARSSAGTAVERGCQAATRRLRWEYTVTYRRHQRIHGTHTNNHQADQTACEHLRNLIPIVLAHHLPGVQLTQWDDPHPAIIDSTWQHHSWHIDIHWDYHPDWIIGDPTALTIHPTPTETTAALTAAGQQPLFHLEPTT